MKRLIFIVIVLIALVTWFVVQTVDKKEKEESVVVDNRQAQLVERWGNR